jgi:hypothetical protein
VGDLLFAQHQFDTRLCTIRIGEVTLERSANQFITSETGERLHLFVDVGNDAGRIGSHQRVDVGFEQGARIKLMVAQALSELLLICLDLLARFVVGADQEVTDDRALSVTQRRDRYDCRKAAAILT